MKELEELTLTKDQDKAFKDIKNWLEAKESFKTLSGYAGTGKTTLLNEVVNYMLETKPNAEVAVTATTNKAVKVLKQKVNKGSFMTIHSLLNIKPVRKKDKEIFEPIKYGDKNNIETYDLVIIDECSMISKKLLEIIKEQSHSTKILFSGDPAQLQPINEQLSRCFSFTPSVLTEIVRYGDVIAKKAKLIRDTDEFIPATDLLNPPTIIKTYPRNCSELFKGFRDNPEKVRLLCWTNKKVEWWNQYLREVDYGKEMKDLFVPGDIVIANEPVIEKVQHDSFISMLNSEEGVVKKAKERSDSWEIEIRTETGYKTKARVVKPNYRNKLSQKLKKLAKEKEWKAFWSVKEAFSDIRHCYAMTTHKSQGSTFEQVVIDSIDIDRNRETLNRNQLYYVAMTRASKKVIIT